MIVHGFGCRSAYLIEILWLMVRKSKLLIKPNPCCYLEDCKCLILCFCGNLCKIVLSPKISDYACRSSLEVSIGWQNFPISKSGKIILIVSLICGIIFSYGFWSICKIVLWSVISCKLSFMVSKNIYINPWYYSYRFQVFVAIEDLMITSGCMHDTPSTIFFIMFILLC